MLIKAFQFPCGKCVCSPGWAGPGFLCGQDADADGWSDDELECDEDDNPRCKLDNCIGHPNSGQDDLDGDELGDECDDDVDGDGILNEKDNCPDVKNPTQVDKDKDGFGDACDNCISISNKDQDNSDDDEMGDLCDKDMDDDGIENGKDNCPQSTRALYHDSQYSTVTNMRPLYIFFWVAVLNIKLGEIIIPAGSLCGGIIKEIKYNIKYDYN